MKNKTKKLYPQPKCRLKASTDFQASMAGKLLEVMLQLILLEMHTTIQNMEISLMHVSW